MNKRKIVIDILLILEILLLSKRFDEIFSLRFNPSSSNRTTPIALNLISEIIVLFVGQSRITIYCKLSIVNYNYLTDNSNKLPHTVITTEYIIQAYNRNSIVFS